MDKKHGPEENRNRGQFPAVSEWQLKANFEATQVN